MMWYGQMAFLLKGGDPGQALVSVAEARIQTLAAALFTLDLDQLQNGGQDIADIWNQVYAVTAFFVGVADDLTPYEDKMALEQVFGAQVSVQALTDDPTFLALRKALAAMPSPQIYGGTGNCSLPPNATAADLDNVLDETKGTRLMGQRFVPDSLHDAATGLPRGRPLIPGPGTPSPWCRAWAAQSVVFPAAWM